jgi:hypothetical protein
VRGGRQAWLSTFGDGRRALDEGRFDEAARFFDGLVAEADDASASFNLGLACLVPTRLRPTIVDHSGHWFSPRDVVR